MQKVVNTKPQMLPKHLPTVMDSASVNKINSAVTNIVSNNAQNVNQEAQRQKQSNQKVPVLDLSKNADVSPSQQLADIMYTSSPERAKDINALVKQNGTVQNIIKNNGHFDAAQALNLPGSKDMDSIYRDIYKVDTNSPYTNEFLRLNKFFDRITGLNPALENDSFNSVNTPIGSSLMSHMYEIMYGRPMNYEDYHYYVLNGNPQYYNGQDFGQLTNDTADGSHLAIFNEVKPTVSEFSKVNYSEMTDDVYRTATDTPQSYVHNNPINPIISSQAVDIGADEISWVLQIPFTTDDINMPIEAATYLTSINISANRVVELPMPSPKYLHALEIVKGPHTFNMSECSIRVLHQILMKRVHTTYNGISKTSLISLVNKTALQEDYPIIYTLVKKIILDLYSLGFALCHRGYLQFLTYRSLIDLRANIRYMKKWSSHFWEYRDFIEIWNDLDEAVAFTIPSINRVLGSTNAHNQLGYFNDNQYNSPIPANMSINANFGTTRNDKNTPII